MKKLALRSNTDQEMSFMILEKQNYNDNIRFDLDLINEEMILEGNIIIESLNMEEWQDYTSVGVLSTIEYFLCNNEFRKFF